MMERSQHASGGIPAWIDDALRITNELALFEAGSTEPEVPMAFRERCHAAAAVVFSAAQLRRERSRVGFLPLPLSEYLQELAKSVGVALHPLLAASGVSSSAGNDLGLIRPWARLCRWLGFPTREAFLHLGMSLAENLGATPPTMIMARRRRPDRGRDPLAECEGELRQALGEIGVIAELNQLEAELKEVYEEPVDEE
jgi:hypothetical protein